MREFSVKIKGKYRLIRIFFLVFSILFSSGITAQIINIESLRRVTDTSGFSGSASLNFSVKRDANEYIGFATDIHVQYKMNRHLVLLKNDLEFQRIQANRFANKGASHLRYNYKLKPRLTWEFFLQGQYNKVSKINFRGLAGTGLRFKLTTSDDYKVYFGTLVMFEQNELDDHRGIERYFRSSSYLSLSLYPTKDITIISTTYYQPKIENFEDYRVLSQTSLVFTLFRNFDFKTTYSFIYDQFPAEGVPRSQYDLKTGIVYSFD